MNDPNGDYFADLPAATQMTLHAAAWKYLRRRDIRDLDTALELLALQRLDIEVLEAHTAWLERARAEVLSQGRPWTVETMNRYAEENPR
ncbi:MAG: hypothetical protein JWR37_1041 [Mycobacterium sp.]|nr:hypothetical protein [Mycobacterium sp.]